MKKIGKILIYCILFMIIGMIVVSSILIIAEKILYDINFSSEITYDSVLKGYSDANSKSENETNIIINDSMQDIQYSYNNKYYTYLKDGNIYINMIENNENIKIIDEEENITFYNLLYDKNLILYFTEIMNGSTAKLELSTYEISSGKTTNYKTMNIYNYSKIEDIEFSPIINIIYLSIQLKNGTNTVYKINLFNSISQYTSGKDIVNMIMLKAKDRLFYELENGTIYYSGSRVNIFSESVDILGVDYNDNVYFLSKENKNKVYVVKDLRVTSVIDLEDTEIINHYSDNTGIYLVYPTYIINVAGINPLKKIVKLSDYVSFVTIKQDTVYLKLGKNIIVSEKLAK